MKWLKEKRAYMWANYLSEDGIWKAWDEDVVIKGGSNKRYYNPETHLMERGDSHKHIWYLKNLNTGYIVDIEFKTLKDAKAYAESIKAE